MSAGTDWWRYILQKHVVIFSNTPKALKTTHGWHLKRGVFPIHSLTLYTNMNPGRPSQNLTLCVWQPFFLPRRCLNRSPLCLHQEASLSNTAHSLSDLSSRLSYSERWEMSRRTVQLPNTSRSMVPDSRTSQAAKARAVLPTQRLTVTVEKRGAVNIWEQPSQLFTGYHPCWVRKPRKHQRFFQFKGNNRHRQQKGHVLSKKKWDEINWNKLK